MFLRSVLCRPLVTPREKRYLWQCRKWTGLYGGPEGRVTCQYTSAYVVTFDLSHTPIANDTHANVLTFDPPHVLIAYSRSRNERHAMCGNRRGGPSTLVYTRDTGCAIFG